VQWSVAVKKKIIAFARAENFDNPDLENNEKPRKFILLSAKRFPIFFQQSFLLVQLLFFEKKCARLKRKHA
jgi:hypothetical protein